MAAATSFKQPCPSCEAMVPIKDMSMVGKKVDCPKCKYRFQVEKPKPAKDSKAQKKKFRDQEEEEKEDELEEVEDDELEEVEEDDDEVAPPVKGKKPQVKAAAAKGKPQAKKVQEDDEEEEEEERPKKAAKKGRDDDEEDEDVEDEDEDKDEDEDDGKKKKKKGNKLVLGLILAGVGVVVLGVGAFFMMTGGNSAPKAGAPPKGPAGGGPPPVAAAPPVEGKTPDGKDKDKKEDTVADKKEEKEQPKELFTSATNETELGELSNYLPNDTDHVLHVFCRNLFEASSPFRDATFNGPGVLDDALLRKRLGFSLLAIDDLLRAESYKGAGWTFTILHFREPVSEAELKTALGLTAMQAIKNQPYFKIGDGNAWFEQLARLTFGVPVSLRQLDSRPANRPSFVRFHGSQTLLIGDQAPMEAFLQAEGAFANLWSKQATAQADPAAPPPAPTSPLEGTNWDGKEDAGTIRFEFATGDQVKLVAKETIQGTYQLSGQQVTLTFPGVGVYTGMLDNKTITGEAQDEGNTKNWKWTVNQQAKPGEQRADMYLTVRPELKILLDKMETKVPGQKIMYSSATNMDAARVSTSLPDSRDRITRRPRQVWDVAVLLSETKPRVKFMGAGLTYKEGRVFQYKNELSCNQEADVKELQKDLVERVSPQIARFLDKLLSQRVDLPKIESATPAQAAGQAAVPMPVVPGSATAALPMIDHSEMTAVANGTALEFTLSLLLDTSGLNRIYSVAAMAAGTIRAEMELSSIVPARHFLAKAGQLLGEKGLSDREVPPGQWPPAAFPRPAATRPDREPLQRVSWMAGLLPFLNQESLYARIEFKDSWRDPANWLAAQTLVPQFLDPSYPDSARRAMAPGIPVEVGATHFVGIAGVGLDAASYRPGDPATHFKRGVLNYEKSLSLEEVQKGRGTANTILMIQVPHDGIAGVTPWMAGGGSTLRGVPEKYSIAPFVLSTDRTGKFIQNEGKRGTFALMTNGSVRFIDQNVSDGVFKAMCTAAGPAPANFDVDKDENTPLVRDPNAKAPPKTVIKKATVRTTTPKVEPPPDAKKAVDEKKAAPEEKKAATEKKATPDEKKAPADEKKAAEPEKLSWRHEPSRANACSLAFAGRPRNARLQIADC